MADRRTQRVDVSEWLCFTDKETGRCYKSRSAAERSDTDLTECAVSTRDTETVRELVTAASRLDAARVNGSTVLRRTCPNHRRKDTSAPTRAEGCDPTTTGPVVLILNLEEKMLPLLVTASRRHGIDVDSFTRQDYLDDLRRREVDSMTLESLRLALQERRGQPLAFVFAYGLEARLCTLRDLARTGCTYFETPVMDSIEDLMKFLETF